MCKIVAPEDNELHQTGSHVLTETSAWTTLANMEEFAITETR